MKMFLLFLFAASNLFSAPFGSYEFKNNEEKIISSTPLLDLLAQRDSASADLNLGDESFYASFCADEAWDLWFFIKPKNGFGAKAWKLEKLNDKVFYSYGQTKAVIGRQDGLIYIQYSRYEGVELTEKDLMEKLYEASPKITFGDAVTYAFLRNLSPMNEEEGIITLRKDRDGNFFYSLSQDKAIKAKTRWLMAANGVLYGLRINDNSELEFVSKSINIEKPSFLAEETKVSFN